MIRLRRSAALFAIGIAFATASRTASAPSAPLRLPPPVAADALVLPTHAIGRHGGRFVIGQASGPRTFNALMANESSSNDVNRLLFAVLAEYDNGAQTFYPMLAKSWSESADGLTWTWRLRRGARFSDGHPITSTDVLFSFEIAYDDSLHPTAQDMLMVRGRKMEISAPDSYTVVLRPAAPYPLMLPAIENLRILPRHVLEPRLRAGTFAAAYGVATPPESLVTSGAWRLKRHVPSERTVLEPNPYWIGVDRKGQSLPYLDELEFTIVPDQSTMSLKFLSGELDALDNVKPEDYATYEKRAVAGRFTLYDLGPSLSSNFVCFNLNRLRSARGDLKAGDPAVGAVKYTWFADPEFRRAVSMAIDRAAIIRGPYFRAGFENWSLLTSGIREWHSPELRGDAYDPAGARRVLARLGYRDTDGDGVIEDAQGHPVSFTLMAQSESATRVATATIICDDLRRVGIRAVPVQQDNNSVVTHVRQDFQYDAVMLGLSSPVPPDPGAAPNFLRSSGASHFWNVRQPSPETVAERAIDSLFQANVSSTDAKVRHRTWTEIQRTLNQVHFVIWLPSAGIKLPVRNGFGNLQPVALPHRLLWNIDRVFVQPRGGR